MLNFLRTLNQPFLFLAFAAVLTGCGGGGGGGDHSPTPKTTTFPMQQAYANHVNAGLNEQVEISGQVDGTKFKGSGTYVITPAFAATFENIDGVGNIVSFDLTITYDGLGTYTGSSGSSYFFDSSYNPTGAEDDDGFYTVVDSYSPLPIAAHVNESGTIAHATVYRDSTKAEIVGVTASSFSIEADAENSVILDLIDQYYAADNTLLATNYERYRVTMDGTMTFVSMNYVAVDGSVNEHVVPVLATED